MPPVPEFDYDNSCNCGDGEYCTWDMEAYPNGVPIESNYLNLNKCQPFEPTNEDDTSDEDIDDEYAEHNQDYALVNENDVNQKTNAVIENEGSTYIDSREENIKTIPPPPPHDPPILISEKIEYNHFINNEKLITKYNSESKKYYFDINQVFSHVTLGRSFADEYYNQINNIVCDMVFGVSVSELSPEHKFLKETYSFHGRKYNKTVIMYNVQQFPMVAYALLYWATNNPEKIA